MSDADRTTALADAILDGFPVDPRSETTHLLEVGIGERTDVAAAIAATDVAVTAVDVVERSVPAGIAFEQADLHALREAAAEGSLPESIVDRPTPLDGVYALRLPPELHEAFADLVSQIGVPGAFTTLGGDPPTVSVTPTQIRGGETIYWIEK